MENVLIDRLERRVKHPLMEITSEIDAITEAMEGLVALCGGSEAAKRLGLDINDATVTIQDEITEILATLAWFKERSEGGNVSLPPCSGRQGPTMGWRFTTPLWIATGGKKNG